MKAMLLHETGPVEGSPLVMGEMETPKPGPGELLVRVTACGVCRSNLHMIEGEWVENGVPSKFPIVPGHEVVGRVAELGEGVRSFGVGDRVGVQPLWSTCERCEYCRTGREQVCAGKEITGETVDGGYAEFVLARELHTYALPDALEDAAAAPLFCPGITALGAVSKADLAPGRRVAVFGVGGVGHIVLQLARLSGAEVFAVSRGARHLELSEELGAVPVDATAVDPVAELEARGGMDSAIVFAPSSAVVEQAIRAVKPRGTVVVGAFCEIGSFPFVEEKRIVGSLLGSRRQMLQVLGLAAAGRIEAVVETFPLSQANEVLGRLKAGEFRARAVLLPEED